VTGKLTSLTAAQKAAMPGYAKEWIERGHRTGRLTEAEWADWERGAKACYAYAGIPWPGVVVRVPSPLVGAFASPIAAYLIAAARQHGAVGGAVRDAVGGAVGDAVDDAVRDAVGDAVGDAVDGAVGGAVGGAVDGAVGGAVRGAVDGAVGGAVRGAVGDAVGDAVHGAVGDAVGGAVDGAVGGAVGDAVDGAVGGAVGDAVDDAVGGAVGDAVDGAVDGAIREVISRRWYYRIGGGYWLGWQAYLTFFREHCETSVSEEIWERSRAFDLTTSAGWWWPHRDFVMVADRPDVLQLEQVRPTGWGSHRLHADHGPAIGWATDGLYFWHGTRIPADPDEVRTWDLGRVLQERNTETRRALIEILGWDQVTDVLTLVSECDDPGNAPHKIGLYDLPSELENLYDAPARILLCTNGTVERDGTRRRFGLPVPANHDDPITAVAEMYDFPVEAYRRLEVRR
jgi:hypothetical protein